MVIRPWHRLDCNHLNFALYISPAVLNSRLLLQFFIRSPIPDAQSGLEIREGRLSTGLVFEVQTVRLRLLVCLDGADVVHLLELQEVL